MIFTSDVEEKSFANISVLIGISAYYNKDIPSAIMGLLRK